MIVGGGAMGSAAAYFLMMLGGPGLRVLVCEADPTYAHAATLRAAGGIRQTFALQENILMSCFGSRFMQGASVELAIDDERPELAFRSHPYLYLTKGDQDAARLRACLDLRAALGVPGAWLDRESLRRRFAWLELVDVDAGLLGGAEEGIVDPEALLRALRRKASALGAEFRAAKVIGFDVQAQRIEAAHLDSGERIRCGCAINAAGAGAAAVAAMAGCEVPIMPRRATTFVFRTGAVLPDDIPIVVDRVQGLHFRREGEVYLASMLGGLCTGYPQIIDYDLFESSIWPALAKRVPAFDAIRFAGAWAGTIDASPYDGNPFIGPHPLIANLLFLAGFNGHGLQHAPAAGRAIAELIALGGYRAIDLSRFSFERLGDPVPINEHF